MKIGIVQHPATDVLRENLNYIMKFATEAKNAGCSLVCFPECSLTGYFPEHIKEFAISQNDTALLEISALASELGIDILAGFMEQDNGLFFITHGIFHSDGSTDFYHKTHLGKKESLYFTPGDKLEVFTLSCGLRIGFQLCVETHFPDITQTLALRGAEIIFAPHAVPRVSGNREHIWKKYIPARSYDNRVYMACCNHWDDNRFGGGCLITDPRGEILAGHYEEGVHLLVAEIDRELISRYRTEGDMRSTHYYPAKRRTELYE